ncbi:MAG: hypothetical protein M1352_03340 [Patescibacteria group bacterium]|nr:hypothetical protein [Patescibacteria group bacterium]
MILFPKVLFSANSPVSGRVQVVEARGVRRLIVNGFVQSVSRNRTGLDEKVWGQLIKFPYPLKDEPNILILGLGGATTVHLAADYLKPSRLTAVELDPLIIKIARDFFDLSAIHNLEVILGDASSFLAGGRPNYDLIVVDLYLGGEFFTEGGFYDFYKNINRRLVPGGAASINRIFKRSQVPERIRYKNLLTAAFGEVIEKELPGVSASRNYLYFVKKAVSK